MLHKSKNDDDLFIKLENCLCECYIKSKAMMMFIKLENCLCKCYIKPKAMMVYLSSWRIVYVNVTSKQKSDDDDIYQVGELFL
jgi:hypothetical protein